jgi:hypothetical protein
MPGKRPSYDSQHSEDEASSSQLPERKKQTTIFDAFASSRAEPTSSTKPIQPARTLKPQQRRLEESFDRQNKAPTLTEQRHQQTEQGLIAAFPSMDRDIVSATLQHHKGDAKATHASLVEMCGATKVPDTNVQSNATGPIYISSDNESDNESDSKSDSPLTSRTHRRRRRQIKPRTDSPAPRQHQQPVIVIDLGASDEESSDAGPSTENEADTPPCFQASHTTSAIHVQPSRPSLANENEGYSHLLIFAGMLLLSNESRSPRVCPPDTSYTTMLPTFSHQPNHPRPT